MRLQDKIQPASFAPDIKMPTIDCPNGYFIDNATDTEALTARKAPVLKNVELIELFETIADNIMLLRFFSNADKISSSYIKNILFIDIFYQARKFDHFPDSGHKILAGSLFLK